MRNKVSIIICVMLFFGCSKHKKEKQILESRIDSLKNEITFIKEKYRTGLGEIMGGIQMHHAKLWYAAINENWKLAEYEIAEIKERCEEAEEINAQRIEMKNMKMIFPAIDSLDAIIKEKNLEKFKEGFRTLTNTCNSCHAISHFEFNSIKIPDNLPVTNQEFKIN